MIMGLTIAELLNTQGFEKYYVLAGKKGADRKIKSVTVMDAPDIYMWLRGGEILITTGFLFKDNLSFLEELVEKIDRAGAAALFIKLGRFVDTLPPKVCRLADKLTFPIVYMPLECAFIDVISPVLRKIIWEQTKIIEFSDQIHTSFINLTIKGKSIEEIIEKVSELLSTEVIYIDMFDCKEDHIEDFAEDEYVRFAVKYEHKVYGYLVFREQNAVSLEYQQIILEHASTVITLQIQRRISNLQIESRYRDQFVRDIIYNNIKSREEIDYRGRNYNWVFERQYRVIIFDVDQLKKEYITEKRGVVDEEAYQVMEYAIRLFEQYVPQLLYTYFSDRAVLIVQEKEDVSKEQYNSWINNVMERTGRKTGYTISAILGTRKESIYEVYKSFNEASYILKIVGVRTKHSQIYHYDDMGLYLLMDQMRNDAALRQLSMQMLQRLKQYDIQEQTQYTETLKTIVNNNWNLKETARTLYIHYNTMKNRYHKLAEILQLNLEKMQDRVLVELAVRYPETEDDVS